MRTLITIDDHEAAAFFALCKERGWSRAKGFREGARLLLKHHHHHRQQENPQQVHAFGLWRNRAIDGVAYQQQLRDAWS